jgi:hypothetical protein
VRMLLLSKKYQRSERISDNPLCRSIYYSIDKEFFFGLLELYKSSPTDLISAARYAVGINKLEYFCWIHEFLLRGSQAAVQQKSANEEKSTSEEKTAGENKVETKSGEKLEQISEVPENQRVAKQLLVDGLLVAYSMKNKRLVRQLLKEFSLDPQTQCPDSPQTIFQWLNNIFPQPQAKATSPPAAVVSIDAGLPNTASSLGVKLVSSRQYLMTLGFTAEDIADMRRCALEASATAVVSSFFKEEKTTDRKVQGSWFEGQLKYEGKDLPELKRIERTTNCCLWIPRNRLLASGCFEPLLQEFCKLTPSIGTKNLKKLKGMDHQQIIRVGGKEYLLDLMYELKVASSPDRLVIYSCDIPDDNNAKLFVALHYVKAGFHGGAGEKQLLNSNALIDLTADVVAIPKYLFG